MNTEIDKGNHDFAVDPSVMGEDYWKIWNDAEQTKIDTDIEANRKSDGVFAVCAPDGTEIKVEQLDHEFKFGAHIFNFNQLGKHEYNEEYKKSYGPGGIFNSATVAFYWKTLEPEPGHIRFDGMYEDSEEFWNNMQNPEEAFHWRRPAPGPVIDFCKARGIRIHGHVLIWGSAKPFWIYNDYCPEDEKEAFETWGLKRYDPLSPEPIAWKAWTGWYQGHWCTHWGQIYKDLSEEEIAARTPVFTKRMREIFRNRVKHVAERFGDMVDSWDVVNESSQDWVKYGKARTDLPVWKSNYGLMPGDYPLHALLDAKEFFPERAKLNVNDFRLKKQSESEDYREQIRQLMEEGAKIDCIGCQMHIFNLDDCVRLANGATDVSWVGTPEIIDSRLNEVGKSGKPIHISEITVTSPGNDEKSRMIQAVLARNLYRKWFSHKDVNAITWWNTVDGCGVKGEPAVSGLFTRDMKKKPAYLALDQLINQEWRTNITVNAKGGKVCFRGFRGKYRLSWTDPESGATGSRIVRLSEPSEACDRFGGDVIRFPHAFLKQLDDVAEPKGEIVRELLAKPECGEACRITIPADRRIFDLGETVAKDFRRGYDGEKDPAVTVEFPVVMEKEGLAEIYFTNEWYGDMSINGVERFKSLSGPCCTKTSECWGIRRVKLPAGRNIVSFRTRHGLQSNWWIGFAINRI